MLTTQDVKEALREALRIAKATGRLNQGVIRFAEDVGEIINIKAEEAQPRKNPWTVSDDEPFVTEECDLFTKGIDFNDGNDIHGDKIEIHGEKAEELEILAARIAKGLNDADR